MRATAPAPSVASDIPFTAELACRVTALRYDDLPADIRLLARQCVLDWFAVTIAGSREELAEIIARRSRARTGRRAAGDPDRAWRAQGDAALAALVNGAASHALDFDDVI